MTSETITTLFNELAIKMGMTIDWTQQNIQPYLQDLCNRYATYRFKMALAYAILGVLIILFGLISWFLGIKNDSTKGTLFGVALTVIGLGMFFINLNTMILAQDLPEKLIIDYISTLQRR